HARVVVEEVALGDALRLPERLVQVGEPDLPAAVANPDLAAREVEHRGGALRWLLLRPAEGDRRPPDAVVRPFRERHARREVRAHPAGAPDRWDGGEGAPVRDHPLQPPPERPARGVSEPGADPPAVDEALVCRPSDQDRRDRAAARALALGEAADDRLDLLARLHLPPVRAAPPRLVGARAPLRNDALDAALGGGAEERRAPAG